MLYKLNIEDVTHIINYTAIVQTLYYVITDHQSRLHNINNTLE